MAVNLVADQLLPRLVSEQSIRESTIPAKASQQRRRVEELNDEYGCHVRVHLVRGVAPARRVFCISFLDTHRLLRCIQGDFCC